jgi:hypothetical protein
MSLYEADVQSSLIRFALPVKERCTGLFNLAESAGTQLNPWGDPDGEYKSTSIHVRARSLVYSNAHMIAAVRPLDIGCVEFGEGSDNTRIHRVQAING